MAKRSPKVVIKIKDGKIKDFLTYIEPRVEFLILNEDIPEDQENHLVFWIPDVTPVEEGMEYFPKYRRFE